MEYILSDDPGSVFAFQSATPADDPGSVFLFSIGLASRLHHGMFFLMTPGSAFDSQPRTYFLALSNCPRPPSRTALHNGRTSMVMHGTTPSSYTKLRSAKRDPWTSLLVFVEALEFTFTALNTYVKSVSTVAKVNTNTNSYEKSCELYWTWMVFWHKNSMSPDTLPGICTSFERGSRDLWEFWQNVKSNF